MKVMEKTYTKEFQVSYADMDHTMALKPSSLFNFLQDMASAHAEMLGFGYSAIYPQNMVWFLLKYRIEFDEYPTGLYNLQITTEPRGYQRLFAHRDFTVNDGNKVLGRVASVWSIIDVETKALVSCETLNNPYMQQLQKREDDLAYSKIPAIQKADISKTFEIRYDDLDVNGHVNNANYIIWALEPLDIEFRSTHRIKTIDMVYKKDVKYGENVISEVEFKDNKENIVSASSCDNVVTTVHIIRNAVSGEDLCHVQVQWRK